MMSINYLLILLSFPSAVMYANQSPARHLLQRKKFIELLDLSGDIARELYHAPINDPHRPQRIHDLCRLNKMIRDKKEEMLIFAIFKQSELKTLDLLIESTVHIIERCQQKIKMNRCLRLLHAKMANDEKEKTAPFIVHYADTQ